MPSSRTPLPIEGLEARQVRLNLPFHIFAALKETLIAGGISTGLFCIGPRSSRPDELFLMWHLPGDALVVSTVPFFALKDVEGARTVALDFVRKWSQRAIGALPGNPPFP